MKRLNTIEDFKQLKPKDKVWLVKEGKKHPYRFVCFNPIVSTDVILLKDGNWRESETFSTPEIHNQYCKGSLKWFTGEYESEEMGQAMIDQLIDKIDSITKIYMK